MIPKILKGNDFKLTITVNDKSEDIAYSISDCDNIIINIIGANKQRWLFKDYVINGNVITGSVSGLPCQVYSTEILLYKDNIHYRSYQLGQFAIVSNASQAGLASNVEFDTNKVIDIYCEFGNGLGAVNDVSARTTQNDIKLSANINNVSIYAADTSVRLNDTSINIDNYIASNNAYTIDTSTRLNDTSNNVDNYIKLNNIYNNNVSTRVIDISNNIDKYITTNNTYTSNTSTRLSDISTYIDKYIISNNTMSADTSIVISDISTRIQKIGVDVSLNSHNNNILLKHYEQYDDDVQDISTRIIAAEKNVKIANTSISDISTRLNALNSSSNTLFNNIYIGSGKKSIKIGDATTASGEAAIAIGNQSQAIGKVSFASGNLAIAKSDISFALGNIVEATNVGETALGNFNISHKNSDKLNDEKNTLLSVGNGIDDNHPHNAIEIMQDGSIYAQGITAPLQTYIKDISTRLSTAAFNGGTVTGATNFTYNSAGTKNTTITALGNVIAGDSSTTTYSIIGATRQCTSDTNRVNTAAFFCNSDGMAKFTHNGGAFSDTDDSYLCFNFDGFKIAYSGGYGTKPTEEYDIISSKGGQTINGTLTCTTLTQSSDLNLKDNIKDIDNDIIDKVSNIDLKSFNFKSDENVKKYGVIAQDLQSAGLSDLVTKNGDYLSVDYTSFLVLKIAQLEKKLNELSGNKYNEWNDLSKR